MTMPRVSEVRERWRQLDRAGRGPSRLVSLGEAVQRHVKPHDLLYFGGSMNRPNAAMFEVARAFWGTRPAFTLAAPAIANQHAPLIRGGLVRKVVTTIHALTFPSPAPHPLYVDADRAGDVEFENWSLLALVQRLQAAAQGLPFAPTTSLTGSDMAGTLERAGLYCEMDDPFSGSRIGAVAPLAPDVTFVHALAADAEGNALFCPPFYDGKWAALAARRAIVVTAERIVDSNFIRRHQHFVQIPGTKVAAVCEVPLGGHPNAVPGDLVPEIGGYPDDYDFLEDLHRRGRDTDALDEWIETWITGCADHEAYLAELGTARIHALKGSARSEAWEESLPGLLSVRYEEPPTVAERHAVLATRMLARRLGAGEIESILAGLGISSLAAWMAAIRSREDGCPVPLMVEAGMHGYLPSPGDPFLFNYRNMFASSMLCDVPTILGLMVGGPGNRAIGVLGAAEVDGNGDLNTSRLPDLMLTGSGGANDIASRAFEVFVTIGHSPRRLVEKVHHVTSPGRAVRTIVTPRAVLERTEQGFMLTRVLQDGDREMEQLVEEARTKCGFELRVADDVVNEPAPTADELLLCRLLDPKGHFLG